MIETPFQLSDSLVSSDSSNSPDSSMPTSSPAFPVSSNPPDIDNQEPAIDVDLELGSIVERYLKQYRLGKYESIETYARLYPEYRDRIEEILPMMILMNNWSDDSACSSAANVRPRVPDALGDYELLGKIGQGGMGSVYKALQVSLNRVVAIKVLSQAKNPDGNENLIREAQVLAQLTHTNIVSVFGMGIENDVPYMVMEYIEGTGIDKTDWRAFYPGDSKETAVAKLGLQVAQALAYSHKKGVVHLDIKPANLLLDEKGTVHISDFGVAAMFTDKKSESADDSSTASSADLQTGGTLRYLAPERLKGTALPDCGQKSDQYAWGISFYELLTNRIAFDPSELPCKTTEELIKRIVDGPSLKVDGTSPELAAIINKSMAYEAAERYDSMDEIVDDLNRFLAFRPVKAKKTSIFRRLWFWTKRQPYTAAAVSLALTFLIAFVVSLSVAYANSVRNLETQTRLRQQANQYFEQSQTNLKTAQRNFKLATGIIDYVLYEGLYPQSPLTYEMKEAQPCPPTAQTNLKLVHKLGWYYYCLAQKEDADIAFYINKPYNADNMNELMNRIQKLSPNDPKIEILCNLRADYSMAEEDIIQSLQDLRQARKEYNELNDN